MVFVRSAYGDGDIVVRHVKAAMKMAPLKTLSVPKQELNAVLLGARLGMFVSHSPDGSPLLLDELKHSPQLDTISRIQVPSSSAPGSEPSRSQVNGAWSPEESIRPMLPCKDIPRARWCHTSGWIGPLFCIQRRRHGRPFFLEWQRSRRYESVASLWESRSRRRRTGVRCLSMLRALIQPWSDVWMNISP